jgi:signal transduction histidine kinase
MKRLNLALNRIRIEVSPYTAFIQDRLVTWTAFWSTIPVSVITAVLFINPNQSSVEGLLIWTAIGLLSHASMVPFVHHLNKRGTRRTHLLMAFFLGALRGVVLNLIAPLFLVSDPLPIFVRALNSGFAFLYFFVIVSIIQGVWGKFEKDLREFLLTFTSIKSKTISSTKFDNNEIDDTERQEAIARLGKLLEDSIAQESDGLTLREQAQAIDRVIAKNIRPKSSQRWKNAELVWPQIHPWRVIRNTLFETKSPVMVVIIIILPLSILGGFSRASFVNAILLQTFAILLIFLICDFADRITYKFNQGIGFNNLLYLFLYIFVQSPIIFYSNYLLNLSSYSSLQNMVQVQVGTMVVAIAFVVTGAMIFSVYYAREEALVQLRKFLPEDKLQDILTAGQTSNEQSEYAQYLHAEVQSQLTASKLLLLKAAESDFTAMSTETTRQVLSRLELLKTPYEKKVARIPKVRLEELTQTWRGLTRIKMDLPPELETVSKNGEIISQLIEESVINAIRHGKAKNVKVTVWIEGDVCKIEVQDDGKLKSTKKPGLGSTLFQVFAPDWKLKTNDAGTLATMSTPF